MKIRTAKELIAASAQLNDDAFVCAMNRLSMHEKDLLIPCPDKKCRANEGEECIGLEPEIVHFGRRVKRMLKGIR